WNSKGRSLPLHLNLYKFLKYIILKNHIPHHFELPSTRNLADQLRVSRSTVIKVYETLKMDRLIQSKSGSCYYINYDRSDRPLISSRPKPNIYPRISGIARSFHENRELINTVDDKAIAFRPGLPPLDVFPITSWRKQANKYWQYIKAAELTYHSESGVEKLREILADYLNINRGIRCEPAQIMVVAGSLQSLYAIGTLLVDTNNEVILENPTFPNVHSIFKGLRAKVEYAPVDKNGIDLRTLDSSSFKNLKAIHLTPSCHYPLGVQLSNERREEVLDFARERKCYVIENDYEFEINRNRSSYQTVFGMDQDDRTFYLSTFNRVLHPSIRLAFMVTPLHLVDKVKVLLRHSHLFVSPSTQFMLGSFIDANLLQKHLAKVYKAISTRKSIFSSEMSSLKNSHITAESFDCSSLHYTVKLPDSVQDKDVVKKLKNTGIIAHQLSKCYLSDSKLQGLILGHSSMRPQFMKGPLEKLAGILRAYE
ncbi:MAG: PLP-dependent aminotransferase family protein, partial [Bacteroidota bacterium]